jgi:integrase/recombinase XerD
MAKQNGFGQAAILSNLDYQKIYDASNNSTHELIFSILRYTGERIGAVLKLDVMNVYANPFKSIPRTEIIFPKRTRKQSPDGNTITREVPICSNLAVDLERYQPPLNGWLFPSPRNAEKHITHTAFDAWLRSSCEKAGVGRKGISTHSPRRTFITRLAEQGVPTRTIQHISGHKSLASLQRYIEVSPDAVKAAVELL